LKELYDKMKATPTSVDLNAIWKELGVKRHGATTELDDSAPLAAIRKAITLSRTTSPSTSRSSL
jgi:hypothetical protein